MALYITKRLLKSLFTLFIILTVVFLLLRMMPIEGYFGTGFDRLTEQQIDAKLNQLGLLDPLPVQLVNFYKNLLSGDLGYSNIYRVNVSITTILAEKIPYSLYFGLGAVLVSMLVGIPMGILMTTFKGKIFDKLGTAFVVIINAVPAAVYYIFIQFNLTEIFKLPILFSERNPMSWILPLISMALPGIAYYAMWTRRYMVDQLNSDYIKLAKLKGLSSKTIMAKHVLKNSIVPLVQYIPSSILFTIAGSIYIESLYSIPGMGGLLVTVIQRQDNTLVQALVLIYSSIGIFGLMLGDILMTIIDPRIKLNRKETAR